MAEVMRTKLWVEDGLVIKRTTFGAKADTEMAPVQHVVFVQEGYEPGSSWGPVTLAFLGLASFAATIATKELKWMLAGLVVALACVAGAWLWYQFARVYWVEFRTANGVIHDTRRGRNIEDLKATADQVRQYLVWQDQAVEEAPAMVLAP